MPESYPNGYKTVWEKEKLLVKSNFSFSHCVFKSFKRLVSQGRQKVSLCGNGLTCPKRQILDLSKLKEFAGNNFKFDETRVENTVWKGEIAHYEQFLLFPHFFQKNFTADT